MAAEIEVKVSGQIRDEGWLLIGCLIKSLRPFRRAVLGLELLVRDDCVEGVIPERGGDPKTCREDAKKHVKTINTTHDLNRTPVKSSDARRSPDLWCLK